MSRHTEIELIEPDFGWSHGGTTQIGLEAFYSLITNS